MIGDRLQQTVDALVDRGAVPGAVALIAEGDQVAVGVAGARAVGGAAMTRDSVFRLASITKPITAAAAMALVDRGIIALDDPVDRWLTELSAPVVLRRPDGPLDDVVPAVRPITVRHLLTSTAGLGFPPDFSWPIAERLLGALHQGPPDASAPPPEEWMARVARTPLLYQPGEGWTYNTSSDLLGVLLARAHGASLGQVLEEVLLAPLGMADTGFAVPGALDRMTTMYARAEGSGELEAQDPADGAFTTAPAFPSGAGGLLSVADDWLAFGRMLLAGGQHDGRQVLSAGAVRLMLTSHVEAEPDNPFLEGQGWGFGGSVDLAATEPFHVPGRYGWVGGTGTAAYVIPSLGRVVVWLSQVQMTGPTDFAAMAEVLALAADHQI